MSRRQKIVLWACVLSPFIALFGLVYLTSFGLFGELPTFEQLENPKNNLATEIISEDGVVLGTYFLENRSKIRYDELPSTLIDALIATEDVRFAKHSGVDGRALVRAVFGVFIGKSSSGGALSLIHI